MDPQLLESLLYQNESETLDFKVAQYPFDKATEKQKGELLKDIIAFSNAWRQTDAFVLIGVEEVKGGRSIVRGITDHLLNRNLQQFVHSKTNRPVAFSYSIETLDGHEIGVITIPRQDRPIYLHRSFGDLKPYVVYIRRGDTTGEAAPDEVFRMGLAAGSSLVQPVLKLDLVDPGTRQKLGASIEVESVSVEVPTAEAIPFFGAGLATLSTPPLQNKAYYRELAQYLRETTFLSPLGLAVTNCSTSCAENVVVTLEFDSAGVTAYDEFGLPRIPSKSLIVPISDRMAPQREQKVSVNQFGEIYEVRAEIGTVPPGTTGWSTDVFYVGARLSGVIEAKSMIAANNLRSPVSEALAISIEAKAKKIEAGDILAMNSE
jgi:Putative DNA-binding domain